MDERARESRELLCRYIFQLLNAVNSLRYRLENLRDSGGRDAMSESYFETSTLYAFGRVLGIERVMEMEGITPF